MKEIKIRPDAACFVAEMLSSCGNEGCDVAIVRLMKLKSPTPLREFASEEGWLKPVFGNLQEYALSEGLYDLDLRSVARYFGGTYHINHMLAKAYRSNIGLQLGPAAGLVLDVLLPLTEDGLYVNLGRRIQLGQFVVVNPGATGVLCYHRGLAVHVPLPPGDVVSILGEQAKHPDFRRALESLPPKVELSKAHFRAIELTR